MSEPFRNELAAAHARAASLEKELETLRDELKDREKENQRLAVLVEDKSIIVAPPADTSSGDLFTKAAIWALGIVSGIALALLL